MHNYPVKTTCYQTLPAQQGSAALAGVLALLMITGIYFLYGLWGWIVIVAMLAATSMAGMITMELGTRRQNDGAKGNSHTAENHAAENRKAENSKHIKSDTLAAGVSGIGTLKATEPAANNDSAAAGNTSAGVNRSSVAGAAACFMLELTSPGKEPVQIMRLLHKELGFPADEAKRAILSRKFPLRLAQGKKEVMQEKAKKLLHAGAKLRLTVCQTDGPEADSAAAATLLNQDAV